MKAIEIFAEFKKRCPNSREKFKETMQNVIRWQWHISNLDQMKLDVPQRPVFRRASKQIIALRERRRFQSFDEMPQFMKNQYGEIASHFPMIQVWACGSRVDGTFVDPWDGDEIREMRRQHGKAEKKQSDFDFWIEGLPTPIGELPSSADWVRGMIPESERIKIAMWDFSKLPESEFAAVLDALQMNDTKTLVNIHDKYQLSPYNYCCELSGVYRWFQSAVDDGTIVVGGSTTTIGGDEKKTAVNKLD